MTTGKFIYIRKAAQELCCTERHIYDLIKSGKLKAIRLGPRGLRVLKCSVDKYIKKNIYKAQKRKR
jgi:excisionase family DNA binding protein